MPTLTIFNRFPVLLKSSFILFLLFSIPSNVYTNEKNANNKALFPEPEALKPNVEFWKMVYGVYPSHKVIIHDNVKMDIIYEIVDFKALFSNPKKVSSRTRWKQIEKIKDNYRNILKSAAKKITRKAALSNAEKELLKKFRSNVSAGELRQAAKRIRGQLGLRDRFLEGIKRSGMYSTRIREIFMQYNLPLELTYLPHVESEFNYKAYSKVGAAGLWQFTRGTGRLFMKINYDIDERFDPTTATLSAAKLLKNNYKMLKSWPLALTAYNHGPNGMRRAKRKFGDDIATIVQKYKSRTFGFASRNFYAEFLAAKHVASNYKEYFGDVKFHSPARFSSFKTRKYYSVKAILKAFNLTAAEFKNYNPALRRPVIRGQRRIPKNYSIRIPDKPNVDEKKLWASIAPDAKFNDQVFTDWYKVRRGDNLSVIARRVGTSVARLAGYNDLNNKHQIYVGQVLKVPAKGKVIPKKTPPVRVAANVVKSTPVKKPAPEVTEKIVPAQPVIVATKPAPEEVRETPEAANKPILLATGLSTPANEIAPPNTRLELATGAAGGFVLVPSEEPVQPIIDEARAVFKPEPISEWIVVEPEETLGHYADWLEVSTNKLRRQNKLAYGTEIRIGQRLKLDYSRVKPLEFQRRRFEYKRGIEEDFFEAYIIAGVQKHKVKRGESIWLLTKRVYDLPLWLLSEYNASINLQDLHVGDELNIPIISEKNAIRPSITP